MILIPQIELYDVVVTIISFNLPKLSKCPSQSIIPTSPVLS